MLNKFSYLLISIFVLSCGANLQNNTAISLEKSNIEKRKWKRSFEEGETRKGIPEKYISGTGNHNSTECGSKNYINPSVGYGQLTDELFKRGNKSFKAGINALNSHPCDNEREYTLRHYPTWDGNFRFPVLVLYWLYIDAPNWESMVGNRFSPLTVKGRFPKEPDEQIFTTHVNADGRMDIGHGIKIFESNITIPLKTWILQGMYLENDGDFTRATIYNNAETLYIAKNRGIQWAEAQLRHWHMGLYGDNNGIEKDSNFPAIIFSIYNDDVQIIEVDNELEAMNIMLQELNNTIDIIPPSVPTNVKVTK